MSFLRIPLALFLAHVLAFGPAAYAIATTRSSHVADASSARQDEDENDDTEDKGLQFRLSEGTNGEAAGANRAPTAPVAQATQLSEAQTQNVLSRLPPLAADTPEQSDFAVRERSLPPPRAGNVIATSFPAPEQPRAPTSEAGGGPLRVLRFSPEGDVSLAPQLSVTFSRPMVALTSLAELAKESVPVTLSPQPEGRWRWLGTRTLVFDPRGHLPMATHFKAQVRAGTRSADGALMSEARSWSFSTPPPTITAKHPTGEAQPRDPLIFLAFDQRIDPAAILRVVRVNANGLLLRARLASAQEVQADATVRDLAKNTPAGRWLALRLLKPERSDASAPPLPASARIHVSVGPGTPSAEGPRVTERAEQFEFRTYGPLKIEKHVCGYEPPKCSPSMGWTVEFSNQLDAEAFQQTQVRVEPAAPGMDVSVSGRNIFFHGGKRGRTTYRVTFDRSLRDVYGQTLGQDATVTFNVGPAEPTLINPASNFVVLDPAGPRAFPVYSSVYRQLKVTLRRVTPDDWAQYRRYQIARSRGERQKQPLPPQPGRLVFERVIAVRGAGDSLTETLIDLSPALTQGLGHVFVRVEPLESRNASTRVYAYRQDANVEAWVQSTNIALDAFVDHEQMTAWANSLRDGSPLAGVNLSLAPSALSAPVVSTGADGLARLALPAGAIPSADARVLVARRGTDSALLPEFVHPWANESSWRRTPASDELRWYVFDDRQTYRPGEEVSIKGWLRRVGNGRLGDVTGVDPTVKRIAYQLKDSRDNEVAKGELQVNAFGGFDATLKLPPAMNLGGATLELKQIGGEGDLSNLSHTHSFKVLEFRRPEFEVKTTLANEGPHFVKSHAEAVVSANYFAGGGLPNAEVEWEVSAAPGHFTPPNRDDFVFGKWVPWWRDAEDDDDTDTQSFTARTDAAGKHSLRIDFDRVRPSLPSRVTVSASVKDVNRQTWNASTSLLVHPAALYVGLRAARTFVQRGQPISIESIVTDLDGRAVAGREVRARAVLLDWVFERGEWRQREKNPQDCVVRSTEAATRCEFQTPEGGTYRITASVLDDLERRNETELTVWVAGGKTIPKRLVEKEEVELIPDRKEYRAGEVAEILVQSPFLPAEGVLTLRRNGVVRAERFRMNESSHTLRVPIEEGFTPNVHAQIDLVGSAPRADDEGRVDPKLPPRPAYASGSLNLSVPPLARKLAVTATPREKSLEPGALTTVDVDVKDAAGLPVADGETAVVVVDESVLALSDYQLADPLALFYAEREPDTTDHHLREHVQLTNSGNIDIREGGGGAGGGGMAMAEMVTVTSATVSNRSLIDLLPLAKMAPGAAPTPDADGKPIRLRENFNALAVFSPSERTDERGRAQVQVKMPDNLTRYRVMAVAVAGGKQFGAGESTLTARLPLMVRPSAPRFLNFGDRFELPVVLQNQTDAAMTVDVAVRATNAELTDGAGRRVRVPPNDRVEVRFPAAANMAGKARFQLGAVAAGNVADAAEVELPVWTPATTEAFATYGEIDSVNAVVAQPVRAPANVFPQFGGLEITTSSTQLQELTDAVLYLQAYPYECSEQIASRVLSVAALRDVLTAFRAKGLPDPEEMRAAMLRDLKRLAELQNDDGSFGFWRRGEKPWPYLGVHVAHAFQRAREKKFDVPAESWQKSLQYLRHIERHIPADYGSEARDALIAYSLYVRHLAGDTDAPRAQKLLATAGIKKLSLEALGWLLPVLHASPAASAQVEAIHQHLVNRTEETAATAHFVTGYGDKDYLLLYSDRRADAVLLEALIRTRPASDLVPKIARGLLAHRTRGRWSNTQENVFALLALDRYFNAYEKQVPDFTARAWLGEAFAGAQEFRGRSTDRRHVEVPMRHIVAQASQGPQQSIVLQKEGPGRLYYRLGLRYAPASLKLDAADYGFAVERVYEAVDDTADVRREADGTWRFKAGARVRVRLTVVAPTRRYHVALVDPLPAGLEALNPSLAVTEPVPEDKKAGGEVGRWSRWYGPWFEHQNLRDERAEAFTTLLWEGAHEYSYVTRATTPGLFVVPPAKAEEMYHPETFGRGPTDRVRVE